MTFSRAEKREAPARASRPLTHWTTTAPSSPFPGVQVPGKKRRRTETIRQGAFATPKHPPPSVPDPGRSRIERCVEQPPASCVPVAHGGDEHALAFIDTRMSRGAVGDNEQAVEP